MGFKNYVCSKKIRTQFALLFTIVFSVMIVLYFFYQKPSYYILQADQFNVRTFSDSWNEGNSEIKILNRDSSSIQYQYRLGEKFEFPFAGVLIEGKEEGFFSLEGYKLRIKVDSKVKSRIPVRVYFHQEGVSDSLDVNTYMLYQNVYPLLKGGNEIEIKFDEMRTTPEWWFALNQVSESVVEDKGLKRVKHLSFFSDPNLKSGGEGELRLSDLELVPDYTKWKSLVVYLSLGSGLLFGLLVWMQYVKSKKVNLVIKKEEDFAFDRQGEADDLEKALKEFVSENYTNSALKVSDIAKGLSVPEYKVGALFNKQIGMNFKTYLNTVRIESAKQYLNKSEYSISEIAYKVGFNAPQSFNRVFKELENMSPTQYRNK